MEDLSELERRKLIGKFYEKHRDRGKAFTVAHFQLMGVSRRTVYSILKRFDEGKTAERKKGSGKVAVKLPAARRRRLVKAACDKTGVSERKLARKFGISQPYVAKVLKEEGVRHYQRQKCPEWTPEQQERQRRCLRKLRRDFCPPSSDVKVIVDDESYFTFRHHDIPGNDGFFTQDKENTPPEVRYKKKKKYEPKILVWLAISEDGHSAPFFRQAGMAINGHTYREECVRLRLKRFIDEVHGDDEILFWPDLASAHYAKDTVALYEELEINVVPREANPPNVPQVRPIEDLWGILKGLVYKDGWEATTARQLQQRIKKCLADMDWACVQDMMGRVKSLIRKAEDETPLAVL